MSDTPQTQTRRFAGVRDYTTHVSQIIVAESVLFMMAGLIAWWLKFTKRIDDITLLVILFAVAVVCLVSAIIVVGLRLRKIQQELANERRMLADFQQQQPLPLPPLVDEFESSLIPAGYKRVHPEGGGQYYVKYYDRHNEPKPAESNPPTYHFFTPEKNPERIKLERFLGFLIPPLDYGHGRKMRLSFSAEWNTYLREISNRAVAADVKRRIVFYDRNLLHLFLFDERIIEDAYIDKATGDFIHVDKEKPEMANARAVVDYAFNVAKIHWRVGDTIERYYVAKDSVAASSYYDFGLYRLAGIDVVYMPIHFKNRAKEIAREKVFIGQTLEQKHWILECEDDFDALWRRAKAECADQFDDAAKHITGLTDPASPYYKRTSHSPVWFERVYAEQLDKKITEHLLRDVRQEDPIPQR